MFLVGIVRFFISLLRCLIRVVERFYRPSIGFGLNKKQAIEKSIECELGLNLALLRCALEVDVGSCS